MSTHNLCFEQKYENFQNFLSENFQFLVVKLSLYLNRCVFVMEPVNIFYTIVKYFHQKIHYIVSDWSPNCNNEQFQMQRIR